MTLPMFPDEGPVLIVDGTNLLVRSEHASAHAALSVEDAGELVNTGAVHVFVNLLAKYTRRVNPSRMVICWDGGRSLFRTKLYPEYKANRAGGKGNDPGSVRRLAREFLTVAGIHHTEVEGWEADDLVAAYWRRHRDRDVVILSGDKDFLQLVGNGTIQIRPGVSPEVWDEQIVFEKMGCAPSQLTKVMSLTGDPGDNVPGVAGVGTKTAVKLLNRYGWSLNDLVSSDERLIQGQREIIHISYKLVDLQVGEEPPGITEVPIFNPTMPHHMMAKDLLDWCARYSMENLATRFQDQVLWH